MPRGYSRRSNGVARTRTRQRAAADARRQLNFATVKVVKNTLARSLETKSAGYFLTATDMYHNQGHFVTGLLNTSQGDGSSPGYEEWPAAPACRIGNELHPLGIKFKFMMETEVQRPNCLFCIYIFRYKSGYASVVNDANFWCGEDGMDSTAIDRILDEPNTNSSLGLKVLKKMVVQHQPNYATSNGEVDSTITDDLVPAVEALVEAALPGGGAVVGAVSSVTDALSGLVAGGDDRICTTLRECYLPYSSKVKYPHWDQENTVPADWNIGVACLPYDANNTSTTDKIGRFGMTAKLMFKDP